MEKKGERATMSNEMTMPEIMARMANLRVYAIFMRPTAKYDTTSDEGRELMRKHLKFQLDMEDAGTLIAAGPLDGAGRAPSLKAYRDAVPQDDSKLIDASGMYFIVATSKDEAEEVAAKEPFESAGWRTHTLCEWQLNEGTAVPIVREMLKKAGIS
jgi:uncharacterized protein YciI